jgi:hypothetical protein
VFDTLLWPLGCRTFNLGNCVIRSSSSRRAFVTISIGYTV